MGALGCGEYDGRVCMFVLGNPTMKQYCVHVHKAEQGYGWRVIVIDGQIAFDLAKAMTIANEQMHEDGIVAVQIRVL